ncbi:sucrose-specific PTS transporter subunit IIBC [Metabacillus iocasae]|uniref:PTS system sucrose-specific IIC component n=1 Tax=Priestia iocasae TaxID=2291674 RepID=A0ABS2QVX5_9BACI|nr:sucrose-specific PTS transporter subunit IIBC [Metabacillus iocasae]MBM7703147.1 PTS system sucrose-specific IIC component [Metabacillus iocasae]
MDPKETGKKLVPLLGGKENVVSAQHCATRLRLVLRDESKVDQKGLDELDDVKGAFSNSGQFQIIFGTGLVNKVYASFAKEIDLQEEQKEEAVNHQDEMKKKMNPFARFARVLSNIFVPIIPAIVASGLLMGLLGMMRAFKWVSEDSALFVLLDMFSSAAFIILPILIGYSAAKEFGANPYLGAVIGGILTHPNLLNPWTLADAQPEYMTFLGYEFPLLGYQGTVVPILLAIYVMSKIEKGLRKVVPNAIDLLVTPFVTVIMTGFISLIVIGPFGKYIGDLISVGLQSLYNTAGFVAGIVFGGLYSTIVLTGLQHSFHAIEAGLIANPSIGVNFLLPIWACANVAQGGAGLAVYFKTKNKKTKEIAIPGAVSSFLGITEPIIFGVNLKLRKPFIAAAIGGAVGGGYVVLMNVAANAYGLTGIPMMAIAAPLGLSNLIHYIIGMVISIGIAFTITFFMKLKED